MPNKAALDSLLQEMRRHQERMERDRTEIERLKAETHVIAAHTESVLSSIKRQLDLLGAVKK